MPILAAISTVFSTVTQPSLCPMVLCGWNFCKYSHWKTSKRIRTIWNRAYKNDTGTNFVVCSFRIPFCFIGNPVNNGIDCRDAGYDIGGDDGKYFRFRWRLRNGWGIYYHDLFDYHIAIYLLVFAKCALKIH